MPRPRRAKPALNPSERVLCSHCGKRISVRQRQRHLSAQSGSQLSSSTTFNLFHDPYSHPNANSPEPERDIGQEDAEVQGGTSFEGGSDIDSDDHGMEISEPEVENNRTTSSQRWAATVEDADDEDNEDPEGDRLLDNENGVDWDMEMGDEDLVADFDTSHFDLDHNLSLDDLLDEQLLQELAETAMNLTDTELSAMGHYALKVETHMTDETFAKLRFACPNEDFHSWKETKAQARALSGFTHQIYDCCINSKADSVRMEKLLANTLHISR
ncbi:hypothetical protein C8R42DRAFT_725258 [Lentinula raphanica]|nr:hypothetical protein C8R42DRAFT_725258 [Lentinula raphanica]